MTTSSTVVDALREAGSTVAVAESLTGGLVVADLVAVPGASDVLRGGVVAYAPDLKTTLLGVDPAHLERAGTVDAGTARQMAVGVRDRLGATFGLSTTGVAGPDPSEGHPPGTVYVAVATPTGTAVERLDLDGDRAAVRAAAVREALALLARAVQR